MTVYATPADWATRTGLPVPTDAVELAQLVDRLRRASGKVSDLPLAFANVAGVPVDAGVAQALRDAVLDQLAYTDATDPEGLGLGLEAVTVGPVSLGGTPGAGGGPSSFSPEVVSGLRRAGILSTRVGAF